MAHFRRPAASRHLVLLPEQPAALLLAQATLADLRRRYPNRPLDVMAPAALAPLASRFVEVDEVLNQPDPGMSWKTFWRAGIDLQGRGYTHAWVLPDRFKPALIPAIANIPERTGYRGRYRYSLLIDIRLPRKDLHPHLLDRYRALAWDITDPLPELGAQDLRVDLAQQARLIQQFNLPQDRPLLALCPGSLQQPAGSAASQLPLKDWVPLLQQLDQQGWQTLLFASRHDQLIADELMTLAQGQLEHPMINLAGQLGWDQVVDVMALTRFAWCRDNALALVAALKSLPVRLPSLPGSSQKPPLGASLGVEWCDSLSLVEQTSTYALV